MLPSCAGEDIWSLHSRDRGMELRYAYTRAQSITSQSQLSITMFHPDLLASNKTKLIRNLNTASHQGAGKMFCSHVVHLHVGSAVTHQWQCDFKSKQTLACYQWIWPFKTFYFERAQSTVTIRELSLHSSSQFQFHDLKHSDSLPYWLSAAGSSKTLCSGPAAPGRRHTKLKSSWWITSQLKSPTSLREDARWLNQR